MSESRSGNDMAVIIKANQDAQEEKENKAYTMWINSKLAKGDSGRIVVDIVADLHDGNTLLCLLEVLTQTKLKREKGSMRLHCLNNINTALTVCEKNKIKLVNIRNTDIYDRRKTVILGLVWSIIYHYQIECAISHSQDGDGTTTTSQTNVEAKKALLSWWKLVVQKFYNIDISSMEKGASNGNAVSAILYACREVPIDGPLDGSQQQVDLVNECLDYYQSNYAVPILVESTDIVNGSASSKAVLMYLSALYEKFHSKYPKEFLEDTTNDITPIISQLLADQEFLQNICLKNTELSKELKITPDYRGAFKIAKDLKEKVEGNTRISDDVKFAIGIAWIYSEDNSATVKKQAHVVEDLRVSTLELLRDKMASIKDDLVNHETNLLKKSSADLSSIESVLRDLESLSRGLSNQTLQEIKSRSRVVQENLDATESQIQERKSVIASYIDEDLRREDLGSLISAVEELETRVNKCRTQFSDFITSASKGLESALTHEQENMELFTQRYLPVMAWCQNICNTTFPEVTLSCYSNLNWFMNDVHQFFVESNQKGTTCTTIEKDMKAAITSAHILNQGISKHNETVRLHHQAVHHLRDLKEGLDKQKASLMSESAIIIEKTSTNLLFIAKHLAVMQIKADKLRNDISLPADIQEECNSAKVLKEECVGLLQEINEITQSITPLLQGGIIPESNGGPEMVSMLESAVLDQSNLSSMLQTYLSKMEDKLCGYREQEDNLHAHLRRFEPIVLWMQSTHGFIMPDITLDNYKTFSELPKTVQLMSDEADQRLNDSSAILAELVGEITAQSLVVQGQEKHQHVEHLHCKVADHLSRLKLSANEKLAMLDSFSVWLSDAEGVKDNILQLLGRLLELRPNCSTVEDARMVQEKLKDLQTHADELELAVNGIADGRDLLKQKHNLPDHMDTSSLATLQTIQEELMSVQDKLSHLRARGGASMGLLDRVREWTDQIDKFVADVDRTRACCDSIPVDHDDVDREVEALDQIKDLSDGVLGMSSDLEKLREEAKDVLHSPHSSDQLKSLVQSKLDLAENKYDHLADSVAKKKNRSQERVRMLHDFDAWLLDSKRVKDKISHLAYQLPSIKVDFSTVDEARVEQVKIKDLQTQADELELAVNGIADGRDLLKQKHNLPDHMDTSSLATLQTIQEELMSVQDKLSHLQIQSSNMVELLSDLDKLKLRMQHLIGLIAGKEKTRQGINMHLDDLSKVEAVLIQLELLKKDLEGQQVDLLSCNRDASRLLENSSESRGLAAEVSDLQSTMNTDYTELCVELDKMLSMLRQTSTALHHASHVNIDDLISRLMAVDQALASIDTNLVKLQVTPVSYADLTQKLDDITALLESLNQFSGDIGDIDRDWRPLEANAVIVDATKSGQINSNIEKNLDKIELLRTQLQHFNSILKDLLQKQKAKEEKVLQNIKENKLVLFELLLTLEDKLKNGLEQLQMEDFSVVLKELNRDFVVDSHKAENLRGSCQIILADSMTSDVCQVELHARVADVNHRLEEVQAQLKDAQFRVDITLAKNRDMALWKETVHQITLSLDEFEHILNDLKDPVITNRNEIQLLLDKSTTVHDRISSYEPTIITSSSLADLMQSSSVLSDPDKDQVRSDRNIFTDRYNLMRLLAKNCTQRVQDQRHLAEGNSAQRLSDWNNLHDQIITLIRSLDEGCRKFDNISGNLDFLEVRIENQTKLQKSTIALEDQVRTLEAMKLSIVSDSMTGQSDKEGICMEMQEVSLLYQKLLERLALQNSIIQKRLEDLRQQSEKELKKYWHDHDAIQTFIDNTHSQLDKCCQELGNDTVMASLTLVKEVNTWRSVQEKRFDAHGQHYDSLKLSDWYSSSRHADVDRSMKTLTVDWKDLLTRNVSVERSILGILDELHKRRQEKLTQWRALAEKLEKELDKSITTFEAVDDVGVLTDAFLEKIEDSEMQLDRWNGIIEDLGDESPTIIRLYAIDNKQLSSTVQSNLKQDKTNLDRKVIYLKDLLEKLKQKQARLQQKKLLTESSIAMSLPTIQEDSIQPLEISAQSSAPPDEFDGLDPFDVPDQGPTTSKEHELVYASCDYAGVLSADLSSCPDSERQRVYSKLVDCLMKIPQQLHNYLDQILIERPELVLRENLAPLIAQYKEHQLIMKRIDSLQQASSFAVGRVERIVKTAIMEPQDVEHLSSSTSVYIKRFKEGYTEVYEDTARVKNKTMDVYKTEHNNDTSIIDDTTSKLEELKMESFLRESIPDRINALKDCASDITLVVIPGAVDPHDKVLPDLGINAEDVIDITESQSKLSSIVASQLEHAIRVRDSLEEFEILLTQIKKTIQDHDEQITNDCIKLSAGQDLGKALTGSEMCKDRLEKQCSSVVRIQNLSNFLWDAFKQDPATQSYIAQETDSTTDSWNRIVRKNLERISAIRVVHNRVNTFLMEEQAVRSFLQNGPTGLQTKYSSTADLSVIKSSNKELEQIENKLKTMNFIVKSVERVVDKESMGKMVQICEDLEDALKRYHNQRQNKLSNRFSNLFKREVR